MSDSGSSVVSVRQGVIDTNGNVPSPTPNGNGVVTHANRPSGLIGVPIRSRDRKVRELVVDLFARCDWLSAPDAYAATRLCHLYRKIERLGADLEDRGLFKADGDPRKAITEWRQLMAEARAHEAALGITAVARAQLGVDVMRGRALDAAAEVQRMKAERR